METKSSIRKRILTLRDEMSHEERASYSKRIMDILLGTDEIRRAKTILCFAGYKSEVRTTELIDALLGLGKEVYLPRVQGMDMDFYRIRSLQDLQDGYKGIPEPAVSCEEVYTGTESDNTVVLMPGAAFAKDGSRIGYGKGFYDRYLAKYDIMNRIALCFSIQLLESIPNDAHDKKASVIVTEKGITECRKV